MCLIVFIDLWHFIRLPIKTEVDRDRTSDMYSPIAFMYHIHIYKMYKAFIPTLLEVGTLLIRPPQLVL